MATEGNGISITEKLGDFAVVQQRRYLYALSSIRQLTRWALSLLAGQEPGRHSVRKLALDHPQASLRRVLRVTPQILAALPVAMRSAIPALNSASQDTGHTCRAGFTFLR